MWTIDYALQLASINYSSAYIHTREAGITYNLFDPPATGASNGGWITGPPYYALLAVAEALHTFSGAVVVDLNIDSSMTANSSAVAGYAVYDNGVPQKLVLFNFSGSQRAVAVRYLTAPSVTEKTAITWDGMTVDGTGILQGKNTTVLVECGQGCSLEVPAPGVAVVYLDSSQAASYLPLPNSVSATVKATLGAQISSFLFTLVLCLFITV
jgi:hypothetical protein